MFHCYYFIVSDKEDIIEIDSDLTDSSNDAQPDEVLIAAHDIMDEPSPLPSALLKTIIKPAGQMIFFGLIDFNATGRRGGKGPPIKPDAILWSPHRFYSDLRVSSLNLNLHQIF